MYHPIPMKWLILLLVVWVAWRLLRSLFTRDAEDANLQDELSKLTQR